MKMSPLLVVGILVTVASSLADVKHVLENNNAPSDVNNFWWLKQDSPLKSAYDYYEKCHLKGNCAPPVPVSNKVQEAPQLPPCAHNQQNFQAPPQVQIHLRPEDLNGNPFLSGGVAKTNVQYNTGAAEIDLSKNPFFSHGDTLVAANGEQIGKSGGFLGVQPAQPTFSKPFSTTHPLDNKKPFSTKHPLEVNDNKEPETRGEEQCRGSGFVCVDKDQCKDGIVNNHGEDLIQVRSTVQYCKSNEVCCQLKKSGLTLPQIDVGEISAGKSSVPENLIKFFDTAGFSSGTIQVLPNPNVYSAGETGSQHSGSSTTKPVRHTNDIAASANSVSPTIDYSNTKFNDVRFASTIQGPAYLPPIGGPTPPADKFDLVPPGISTYQPVIPTRPPYQPTPSPSYPSSTVAPTTEYLPPSPSSTAQNQPSTPGPYRPQSSTPNPQITVNYLPPSQPTPNQPRPQQTPPRSSVTYLPPTETGYSYPTPPSPYSPDQTKTDTQYAPFPTTTTRRTPSTPYLPPGPEPVPEGGTYIVTVVPTSCAAALKCVQEQFCSADGFISSTPVVLTKEQELLRVPTTICRVQETGSIGKCCRDANYVDAWPSANLVNGIDDGQYAEDDSIGQYRQDRNAGQFRPNRNAGQQRLRPSRSSSGGPRQDSASAKQTLVNNAETCGTRHYNGNPKGQGPLDVAFAEIPWQAMILRDSNRSLLCGGVIIKRDAVLTAAHCVEGLETSDILIKGGEWKLGIDEEPLPFQIVKVAAIIRHPQYQRGSLQNDLAVLVLEEKLRLAKNIGTICLPASNQIPTANCIATGWGKRILQLHARGALMRSIPVNIMDNEQCQNALNTNFPNSISHHNPNTLCGFSDKDQCKVDYGSALACSSDGSHYTLSGIFSWDTGCRQEGQIGGYIAPDVEWIKETLAQPLNALKKIDREYAASFKQ